MGILLQKMQSAPEVFAIQSPIYIEFVRVPSGEFLMGSDPTKDPHGDREKEQPQHLVFLHEYYIGRYPITNLQYAIFVKATAHHTPRSWKNGEFPSGKEKHPASDVSWNDAITFCEWLSHASGRSFRLPTEAEWEKAARGTDGRVFPWGNDWDPSRVGSEARNRGETVPVGSFSPRGDSPYHAVDMVGNTFEYCNSQYRRYPYNAEDGREEPTRSSRRVVRGGLLIWMDGGMFYDVQCATLSLPIRPVRFVVFELRCLQHEAGKKKEVQFSRRCVLCLL